MLVAKEEDRGRAIGGGDSTRNNVSRETNSRPEQIVSRETRRARSLYVAGRPGEPSDRALDFWDRFKTAGEEAPFICTNRPSRRMNNRRNLVLSLVNNRCRMVLQSCQVSRLYSVSSERD